MKNQMKNRRRKTALVGALTTIFAYLASMCFAEGVAEVPVPAPAPVEPLVSMIIPEEPVIGVYVQGEGLLYFRESEIRPQDR